MSASQKWLCGKPLSHGVKFIAAFTLVYSIFLILLASKRDNLKIIVAAVFAVPHSDGSDSLLPKRNRGRGRTQSRIVGSNRCRKRFERYKLERWRGTGRHS